MSRKSCQYNQDHGLVGMHALLILRVFTSGQAVRN